MFEMHYLIKSFSRPRHPAAKAMMLIALSFLIFLQALPQAKTTDKYKEITQTDITVFDKISALNINVFGVHLGMRITEVKNLLKNNTKISIEVDIYNPLRYYVYEKITDGSKKNAIAYLIWDEKEFVLKEITMYQSFVKYTIGKTNKLFTNDVFLKESDIVKYFLGLPYKRKTTLDVPSLGLKSYAYYYYRNIMITKNISDEGTTLSLSFVLKPEK